MINDIADKLVNVAAYARVSTDKDDQANSFDSQVSYFSSEIQRHENWNLVKVYADEGITGTSTNKRDQFNKMIEDALDGKIDIILTKEVSRFARNTLDSIKYTRKLKDHGVAVVFMIDGIDTRQTDGELRLTIMSALAQDESRKTSERVKWGQKRQMEKGVVFGRDLLGYTVKNGKLELEPVGAEIVKSIFHKYTVEGKGTYIIARELKEAGIKPMDPDGRQHFKNDWSATVIIKILRNEKYVGDLCQKKTWTKNYLDHKKRYNRGEEEMVYLKDHHPEIAIISRELWDATQEELERRSQKRVLHSKHSNRYWCSGKIECPYCGGRFTSKTKHTKGGGIIRQWHCFNHIKPSINNDHECSNTKEINERNLLAAVSHVVRFLCRNCGDLKKEILSELNSVLASERKAMGGIDGIKTKVNQLETRKAKLMDFLLDGTLSKEEFLKKKAEIDEEILKIQSIIEKYDAEEKITQQGISKINDISSRIDELLSLNLEDSSKIAEEITEKIMVFCDNRISVKLKGLPFVFDVYYDTKGRQDNYTTIIEGMNIRTVAC